MYKHQPYPTWRYHKNHEPKLIKTEEEDKKLGHGWCSSPAHVDNPPIREKLEDIQKMEPRFDSEEEMKESEVPKTKKKEKAK